MSDEIPFSEVSGLTTSTLDFFQAVRASGEALSILRTRSRHEKKVELQLQEMGVPVFLPVYKKRLRRRAGGGRMRDYESLCVLFPGYVFTVQLGDRVAALHQTNAIASVLQVPDCEREPLLLQLSGIARTLGLELEISPYDELQIGKRAVVARGSLKGAIGIITGIRTRFRFVLNVTLLGRSVGVEIDPADLDVET